MSCAIRPRPMAVPTARLTDAERAAIRKLLGEKSTREGTYCAYHLGWSDARVAQEAIPGFPGNGPAVVGKIRSADFGYLKG